MRCKVSLLFPEAARDLDQQHEHCDRGDDEIAQGGGVTSNDAEEHRANTHVSVNNGISHKGKLPARQAPGERRATRNEQREKPQAGALPIEYAGEQCPKKHVGRDVQISAKEMRLQTAASQKHSANADQYAVQHGIFSIRCVLMCWPTRNREPKPSRQRGQSERQHEAIVKTISQEEKEASSHQQIKIRFSRERVKSVLQVSEFDAPDQAAEVKHIVENWSRCGGFRGGPGVRAGEAVPKTDAENGGENGHHENVTQLLRPCGD